MQSRCIMCCGSSAPHLPACRILHEPVVTHQCYLDLEVRRMPRSHARLIVHQDLTYAGGTAWRTHARCARIIICPMHRASGPTHT